MPKTLPESRAAVIRGWRFPITPRVVLALAGQTFRYSVRRKVLLVLVLFAVVLWISYSVAPKSFPDKRVELVIQASLIMTSFFGVIVMVFLASTTIPDDLESRTIYTVLTKPVGRLNYLLGRIVGFAAVGLVLLVVMGLVSEGFIRWTASWASRQMGGQQILHARRHAPAFNIAFRPTPDAPDESAPFYENTDRRALSGPWSDTLVFRFTGSELSDRGGEDVTVAFQNEILSGEKLPRCTVSVAAVNPVTGYKQEVPTVLDSMRRSEVTFKSEVADPEKGMEVQVRRMTAGVVLFSPGSVALVLHPAPFEFAFAKSLLMIFFAFVLVAVIGVMASSFLSRWVAVVLSFWAYLMGVFSEVLSNISVTLSSPQAARGLLGWGAFEHTHGPAPEVQTSFLFETVNKFFAFLFKTVTFIVPDFRHFDAGSMVVGGYDVPLSALTGALFFAGVYGLVYLAIAHVAWYEREVGA